MRKPTIKDVANLAKVSMVQYLGLSINSGIKPKTDEERVQIGHRAVKRYIPIALARSMVRKETNTIGVMGIATLFIRQSPLSSLAKWLLPLLSLPFS